MPADSVSEEIAHLRKDKGRPLNRAVSAAKSMERREKFRRKAKRGTAWVPLFLAWHEFREYRILGAVIDAPDAEEFSLRQRFELSDAQLAWRRWAIRNKCHGKVDKFRQEYPSYAEEMKRSR